MRRLWRWIKRLFAPEPPPDPETEWRLSWRDPLNSRESLGNWPDRLVNGPLDGRLHLVGDALQVERRKTDQVAESDAHTGRSRTEIGFADGVAGVRNRYSVDVFIPEHGFPVLESNQDVIVMQMLSRSPKELRGYAQPTISLAIVRKEGQWLLQAWYINTSRPDTPLKWFTPFRFDDWHRLEVEVLWSTNRGDVVFRIDGEEFGRKSSEPTLVSSYVNSITIGQYAAKGVGTAFVVFGDFERWIKS